MPVWTPLVKTVSLYPWSITPQVVLSNRLKVHLAVVLSTMSAFEDKDLVGWLVVFWLSGPLRQYFSLYQAVSQREGERGDKG